MYYEYATLSKMLEFLNNVVKIIIPIRRALKSMEPGKENPLKPLDPVKPCKPIFVGNFDILIEIQSKYRWVLGFGVIKGPQTYNTQSRNPITTHFI